MVRETNESIEILIREDSVAYLISIEQSSDTTYPEESGKLLRHKQTLAKDGIILIPATQPIGRNKIKPKPMIAEDGNSNIDSVAEIRSEKEW